MKKEDMIRELYEHKIMNTVRAKYRETMLRRIRLVKEHARLLTYFRLMNEEMI